jgi:hypothetical protein
VAADDARRTQASPIARSIASTGIVTSVVSLPTLMVNPLPAIGNPQ